MDPEVAAHHRVDRMEEGGEPGAVGHVDVGAVGRRDQAGDLQRQGAVVGAEVALHVAAQQLAEIAAAAPHLHHPPALQGVAVGVEGDRPAVAQPQLEQAEGRVGERRLVRIVGMGGELELPLPLQVLDPLGVPALDLALGALERRRGRERVRGAGGRRGGAAVAREGEGELHRGSFTVSRAAGW